MRVSVAGPTNRHGGGRGKPGELYTVVIYTPATPEELSFLEETNLHPGLWLYVN